MRTSSPREIIQYLYNILSQTIMQQLLSLSMLGKISAGKILKYFSYFFPQNKIGHFMQIIFLGYNLHEMLNLVI